MIILIHCCWLCHLPGLDCGKMLYSSYEFEIFMCNTEYRTHNHTTNQVVSWSGITIYLNQLQMTSEFEKNYICENELSLQCCSQRSIDLWGIVCILILNDLVSFMYMEEFCCQKCCYMWEAAKINLNLSFTDSLNYYYFLLH
jgi:hypothetical protein